MARNKCSRIESQKRLILHGMAVIFASKKARNQKKLEFTGLNKISIKQRSFIENFVIFLDHPCLVNNFSRIPWYFSAKISWQKLSVFFFTFYNNCYSYRAARPVVFLVQMRLHVRRPYRICFLPTQLEHFPMNKSWFAYTCKDKLSSCQLFTQTSQDRWQKAKRKIF